MKNVRKTLGLAMVSLLATSALAQADEATAWRVFVSDRDTAKVTVVDTVAGTALETFEVGSPASLSRTGSGNAVFAVQSEAGKVTAYSSGIVLHDHGEHGDIEVVAPKPTGFVLEGDKPAHFVELRGNIAQWFDGEDKVRLFGEGSALKGTGEVRSVSVVAAHHGVAVPFGQHVVVSIPNPEDASKRPIGARVVDLDGKPVGEDAACPGLHGSAGSGDLYALACDTGLLLIRADGGVPVIRHLAYSKDLPEGSSSTLIGGKGLQYFVGNYGPGRVVVIDPSEEKAFRLIELPARRVHFATDPVRPKFAYVFTEDGQLHRIDIVAGKIVKSVELTEPYSMDGHWNDPRPRIAVAGDRIVVTDPLASKLRLVDAESFTEVAQIGIQGKPYNIVAVGGSGKTHDGD